MHYTTYRDIKDGECYKDVVRMGFFAESGTCNLTILMNTDGVPIFKSSGFSIWPILLQITELPFHLRYACMHILYTFLLRSVTYVMYALMSKIFTKLCMNFENGSNCNVHFRNIIDHCRPGPVFCFIDLETLLFSVNFV